MNEFSRKRTAFAVVSMLLGSLALLPAQPPPPTEAQLQKGGIEEEDPIPKKPQRKIIIEEEGPPAVLVPKGCYYVRMDDLARAAADTRHSALKELIRRHVVAADVITGQDNVRTRICPVPLHKDAKFPDPFGVFPLNDKDEPRRVVAVERRRLQSMEHYEETLMRAAAHLIKPPAGGQRDLAWEAPEPDRYLAAEQLLSAAILFYDTARDASKRRGTQWETVRRDVVTALADTRLKRLKLAAKLKDWETVRTLGSRMANLYPNDLKMLEEVFAARLDEAVIAAGSDQLADLERARELLVEFESRFPGSKNSTADEVRKGLRIQTQKLFTRAEHAVKTEDKDATRLLRTLEILDPNYPGLRDLMGQLKSGYTILTVGVPVLPTSMSPLTATSDADRMAVELLFESLVDAIPDEVQGVRYLPNLAVGFPTVSGGARTFTLTRPVEWAGLNGQYADASDVAGTLKLLKTDYRGTWAAANADFITDQTRIDDPATLRLAFQGSHPYPLSLLDFKILPTRWLASEGMKPDEPKFSTRPFGTGPYKALLDQNGKVTAFVANPAYGRRPGKAGQPFIKEVQFVDIAAKPDITAMFKTERLHLLPDVPTGDLNKYTGAGSGLVGRVQVVTATQNRRIWMLAVNHRRPTLRSVPLRRGLAYAFDREGILNSVFRNGYTEYHRALTGPFPPATWATPKTPVTPPPLFNRDLALAKLSEHLKSNGTTLLRLVVPNNDPRAKAAAEMMVKNVESVGTTSDGQVSLSLEFLPPAEFDRVVFRERNFDLAYVPMDYPNDWYPQTLSEMLDPGAAGPGGRNIGGYLDQQANTAREDDSFARLCTEIRRHADYSGSLVPKSHRLHREFNEAMPFIPLWQLDRHMIMSTKLQISFDDDTPAGAAKLLPQTIFTRVGRWKLE